MNKKITALLLSSVMLAGAFTGCSSGAVGDNGGSSDVTSATKAKEEVLDLSDLMNDLSTELGSTKNAADVDMDTLNSFFGALASSKYRVYGVASNYKCNEYNGYSIATLTITNNNLKYVVRLNEPDDSIKDGDYLEIEGKLGTSLSEDNSQGYAAFSLSKGKIVDRGDSVKKKIK